MTKADRDRQDRQRAQRRLDRAVMSFERWAKYALGNADALRQAGRGPEARLYRSSLGDAVRSARKQGIDVTQADGYLQAIGGNSAPLPVYRNATELIGRTS